MVSSGQSISGVLSSDGDPQPKVTLMPLSEREMLRVNIEGRALEKAGRVDEAIALYEHGVGGRSDTPFTYTRLRVLYRKLKRPDDVERIKRLMMERWGHWW